MSTRSYICLEQPDGKLKGIYCHHDGYLTYNGAMLIDHYSEREKVEKMIELGDMSSLREKLEPNPKLPHDFEHRQKHVTVFYHRDKGDKREITEARDVTLEDVNKPDSWIEYCYVYGLDNKWRYFVCGQTEEGPKLKDLQEGLDEEYRKLGFKRPEGYYGFYFDEDIKALREQENQAEM